MSFSVMYCDRDLRDVPRLHLSTKPGGTVLRNASSRSATAHGGPSSVMPFAGAAAAVTENTRSHPQPRQSDHDARCWATADGKPGHSERLISTVEVALTLDHSASAAEALNR
jgi:hypothetical protein